mgnify:CR=1 FL=1
MAVALFLASVTWAASAGSQPPGDRLPVRHPFAVMGEQAHEPAGEPGPDLVLADPADHVADLDPPFARLCLDRETAHFQQLLSLRYAELVYYGLWFTSLREALDAFFASTQRRVTGAIGLKLYKGNVSVTRRCSPHSLYRLDLATYDTGDRFDQRVASECDEPFPCSDTLRDRPQRCGTTHRLDVRDPAGSARCSRW